MFDIYRSLLTEHVQQRPSARILAETVVLDFEGTNQKPLGSHEILTPVGIQCNLAYRTGEEYISAPEYMCSKAESTGSLNIVPHRNRWQGDSSDNSGYKAFRIFSPVKQCQLMNTWNEREREREREELEQQSQLRERVSQAKPCRKSSKIEL